MAGQGSRLRSKPERPHSRRRLARPVRPPAAGPKVEVVCSPAAQEANAVEVEPRSSIDLLIN